MARRASLLGVCLLALAGIGAAIELQADNPEPPVSERGTHTESLSSVIAAARARFNSRRVVSARADPETLGYPPLRHPETVRLLFRARAQAADFRTLRPRWEVDLLQGAIAEALAAWTPPVKVSGAETTIERPNGTVLVEHGGMGDIGARLLFTIAADADVRETVRETLSELGLAPVSIEILRAIQPAPAVVARTSEPEAAARAAASTIGTLFGRPSRFVGYYFEVRGPGDEPLFVQAASFRTGAGTTWVSPALEDVISLAYSRGATG